MERMEDFESAAIGFGYREMGSYWDLQNFGVFNSEENTPPFMWSSLPMSMDYSSGYLQDALLEFTSKRRRFKFDHHHPPPPNMCNSDYSMNFHENYDYFTHMMTKCDSISGEYISSRRSSDEEGSIIFPESSSSSSLIKSKLETYDIEATAAATTCSSSFNNGILKQDKHILHFPSIAPGNYIEEQQKRKKNKTLMTSKVVYPFALVKPGGAEGDVTLNDINRRILMPPTRPVRHPVGEYACRPIVSSSDGPGLSGKEVVTLTRIRTLGRGTITIIRTKN